jgi:hypothetical protein
MTSRASGLVVAGANSALIDRSPATSSGLFEVSFGGGALVVLFAADYALSIPAEWMASIGQ